MAVYPVAMVVSTGWVRIVGEMTSSLRIVPVPVAFEMTVVPVAFTRFDRVMTIVSSGSESVSPLTVMWMGSATAPAAVKSSVPEASVAKSEPGDAVPPVTA